MLMSISHDRNSIGTPSIEMKLAAVSTTPAGASSDAGSTRVKICPQKP